MRLSLQFQQQRDLPFYNEDLAVPLKHIQEFYRKIEKMSVNTSSFRAKDLKTRGCGVGSGSFLNRLKNLNIISLKSVEKEQIEIPTHGLPNLLTANGHIVNFNKLHHLNDNEKLTVKFPTRTIFSKFAVYSLNIKTFDEFVYRMKNRINEITESL